MLVPLRAPRGVEQIIITLVLFWYSDAMTIPVLYFTGSGLDTDFSSNQVYPARRLVLAIMYFFILVLAIPYRKRIIAAWLSNPILLLFVCWAFLSVLWSVAPEVSLRRSVGILVATTFGFYLAMFNPREMLRLLAWALSLVMLASLIFTLLIPDIGIMSGTHDGAWRGAFSHKNTLGAYALLSLIVLSSSTLGRHRWAAWLLSGALLFLSNAKTPIIASTLLVGLFLFARNLNQRSIFSAPKLALFCLFLGAATSLSLVGIEAVLNLFGGDTTLTGRTRLWALVWESIQSRFWLGHGFQTDLVEDLTRGGLPNAHNGLLEVWLGLGLVGAALILASFFQTLFRAIKDAHLAGGDAASWTLMFLAYLFLLSVTESSLIGTSSLTWVCYVAAAALHTQARQHPPASSPKTQSQTPIVPS